MEEGKENDAGEAKQVKSDWALDALHDWAQAAERNHCDLLRLNGAPEWVFSAYAECAKVILPSGLPPVEKWNAEFVGEFFGRFLAMEKVLAGEVPLGPETRADLEKLMAISKKQPLPKNSETILKDVETRVQAFHESIPLVTSMAANSSYGELLDFQSGFLRGISINPEELATSRVFRRHTRTFWVLALHWRMWARCKSLREVYQHLSNAVGEKKIGSFKTFETHVAGKIGMKIRSRGRPKNSK